jgi:hypothetical protein
MEDGNFKKIITWELISNCYDHGIMKGELWAKRKSDCEKMRLD